MTVKKFFKGLLWFFVCFIAVDAAVVAALPHFLPMAKVEALVRQKVREATGRDIAFKSAKFVFWPDIGVRLTDVAFGNPVWAAHKNMLSLGEADVALAVMPLLHKQVVVKRFILSAPDIDLEIGANGQKNWDFSTAPAAVAVKSAADSPRKSVPAPSQFAFHFGEMRISNGKLVFTDMQKNQTVWLRDIDVNVKWPDSAQPLHIGGTVTYKGKRIALTLALDKPADLLAGRQSAGEARVKTDDLSVKAGGDFATQGVFFSGGVDAGVPDLASFLAWVRDDKTQRKLPFHALSFSGNARLERTGLTLKESTLALDDVRAKGGVSVSFTKKPDIVGRLSLNKLDLDRFTGGGTAAASGAAAPENQKTANARGWDATPLDFSGLNAVDADLQLDTQGFTLRDAAVGPSMLTVRLQNGDLRFQSSKAPLFGGYFSSDLGLDAAGALPKLALVFDMQGVQAEPVLATFAHFDKLSGAATAHVSVTASGDSQKAIISSLDGGGGFDFKNGALKGIDMVKIAELVQAHSSNTSVGAGETRFVDMTGTFKIARGVASNNDLKVTGAVLRATGGGTVDLPQKYINYRVRPELLSSTGTQGASGVSVPVDIRGPFDNIKVVPDFVSAVRGIAANPSAARQTIRNIRDNFKQNPVGALQNLLGGSGLLGH